MTYIPKYKHKLLEEYKFPCGVREDPSRWIAGPDEIQHDKYYALLKHKAQAKFRGEDHSLTWEQWKDLWPNDKWLRRGRRGTDLCLSQIDRDLGWHYDNVHVIKRIEYLQRAKEYRDRS